MRLLLRWFDAWLARAEKVFAFSEAPDCLLRLQIAKAPHALNFGKRAIPAGEPVLMLHLYNSHLPVVPRGGPSLAWAKKTQRMFFASLRGAACHIEGHPGLSRLAAVGLNTALIAPDPASGGMRFLRRLGFTPVPYRSTLGRFGEFWENLYAYWLIWAYNPAGLRYHRLPRLKRTEAWMTMDDFLRKYGPGNQQGEAKGKGL